MYGLDLFRAGMAEEINDSNWDNFKKKDSSKKEVIVSDNGVPEIGLEYLQGSGTTVTDYVRHGSSSSVSAGVGTITDTTLLPADVTAVDKDDADLRL